MNHEDYCSYELSKKLKEKGFDYPLSTFYDDDYGDGAPLVGLEDNYNKYNDACAAPTLGQAQKWLRENKDLHIDVVLAEYGHNIWNVDVVNLEEGDEGDGLAHVSELHSYEAALSAGIEKALELL